MKFDVNKLMAAIDEWSMHMPAEDIRVVVPDNSEKKRDYLGISAIAKDCQREVFYDFRKIVLKKEFPPRMMRLFQRGHREEFFMVHMLRGVGLTIYEQDSKTGKQFRVSDFEDHLRGSMDGIIRDKKMLFVSEDKPFKLETKTYNAARFKKLQKEGVKVSDPKYYGQMQGYLGYERRLAGALFCAVCKDDDDLHFEWIAFDRNRFEMVKERADIVINARTPPKRIANRKSDWRCTFCDYKEHCFSKKESDRSCRSCFFASPAAGGTWECGKGKTYGQLCTEWEDCNR